MVKKWEKFIEKNIYKTDLEKIILDISQNSLKSYFCRPLKGHKETFRIRKGNIRIIFRRGEKGNEIIAVDTRGQIYKSIK